MKFSAKEIRDLFIAWLTISVSFGWILSDGIFNFSSFIVAVPLSAIAVGTGFILHELAHKYVAIHFGAFAEFRAWNTGLVLALVSAVMGFLFAAPGAVYIQGRTITREQNGLISLAGPMANIVIAAIFFGLKAVIDNNFFQDVAFFTIYINLFLAFFNLLPIFILDGAKVFKWNVVVWGMVFFPVLYLVFFARGIYA